jgi:hypothetical protein
MMLDLGVTARHIRWHLASLTSPAPAKPGAPSGASSRFHSYQEATYMSGPRADDWQKVADELLQVSSQTLQLVARIQNSLVSIEDRFGGRLDAIEGHLSSLEKTGSEQ